MAALAAAAENQGLKPKSPIAPSSARVEAVPYMQGRRKLLRNQGFKRNPRVQQKMWDTLSPRREGERPIYPYP